MSGERCVKIPPFFRVSLLPAVPRATSSRGLFRWKGMVLCLRPADRGNADEGVQLTVAGDCVFHIFDLLPMLAECEGPCDGGDGLFSSFFIEDLQRSMESDLARRLLRIDNWCPVQPAEETADGTWTGIRATVTPPSLSGYFFEEYHMTDSIIEWGHQACGWTAEICTISTAHHLVPKLMTPLLGSRCKWTTRNSFIFVTSTGKPPREGCYKLPLGDKNPISLYLRMKRVQMLPYSPAYSK